jgi:hypothetical protein
MYTSILLLYDSLQYYLLICASAFQWFLQFRIFEKKKLYTFLNFPMLVTGSARPIFLDLITLIVSSEELK